ncbi:hypothetical protein KJY77_02770 [Canibacter sp. lx-72]|uniref:hypothetical protein n=1 Tax=Canibacter zhuwentaonis TaxID=2837491 RepID=UPI001BDC2722|nr:hypothetical protein [Canibacter zhuwentaonis]MBT1018065.1 hypothetical protein [Canibacter zhuwentaonis]
MALILADVLTEAEALRGGRNLRQANAVVFTPVYPPQTVSKTSPDSLELLRNQIESHRAYTSITSNLTVTEPELFGTTRTIAVVGSRAFEMFPSLGRGCTAPCVLRGAALDAVVDPLVFRGTQIEQGGSLPRGATWFDANAAGLNLDSFQILVLAPDQFEILDEYEREKLLTAAVLLDPESDVMQQFLKTARASELYLVPSYLATDQTERFNGLMTRAALYVLALLAFSGLAIFSYSAAVGKIIKQES